MPAMCDLSPKDNFVVFGELVEIVETGWILSDEGTFAEYVLQVREPVVSRETSCVFHELIMRDTFERVGEPRSGVVADGV